MKEAEGKLIISSVADDDLIDEWIWANDTIIYEDKFGRKWKLIPVTNENIKFPFIIEPIGDKI